MTIRCCAQLRMAVQAKCGPRRGQNLLGSFDLLSHLGVLALIV
jgi:hypothetical protein